MVGNVNRKPHVYVREDQAQNEAQAVQTSQTPVLTPELVSNGNTAVAPVGEIRGMLEIRDKDGNLKATVPFGGTTGLTREELEKELGMKIPLQTGGEKENGGDPDNGSPKRGRRRGSRSG